MFISIIYSVLCPNHILSLSSIISFFPLCLLSLYFTFLIGQRSTSSAFILHVYLPSNFVFYLHLTSVFCHPTSIFCCPSSVLYLLSSIICRPSYFPHLLSSAVCIPLSAFYCPTLCATLNRNTLDLLSLNSKSQLALLAPAGFCFRLFWIDRQNWQNLNTFQFCEHFA